MNTPSNSTCICIGKDGLHIGTSYTFFLSFASKHMLYIASGDVLFLHCNTLHTSMPNDSDMRRWAFICCYNKASNNPYMKHHHPQYTPLQKVRYLFKGFYTPPLENAGGIMLQPQKNLRSSIHPSISASFPGSILSIYRSFFKLCMEVHIGYEWFGIYDGQISSKIFRVLTLGLR